MNTAYYAPIRLFSAILARNEAGADRYLGKAILRCLEFSDAVLVLDDRSTDRTAEIALNLGAKVRLRKEHTPEAWGNEGAARQELWEYGLEYATEPNDWVLVCDSDMLMQGNVRDLCRTRELNTWSFILFDLWNEQEYRSDQFWRGHLTARPWLFAPRRVPNGWTPTWGRRGLHVGHQPQNWYEVELNGIAPPDEYHWHHLAYLTPAQRAAKHKQYLEKSSLLNEFERAHAESIIA